MAKHDRNFSPVLLCCSAIALAGCGGTKVLKEAVPLQVAQPLAEATDNRIHVTLDWVVVRGGPGTWAKNADWDQYLIRVQSVSPQSVRIQDVTVVDSLETRISPQRNRKQLVKASRKTAKRYKSEGVKVKAGAGMGTMMATGAVVTAAGVGAAYGVAQASLMSGAATAGGGAVAASGLILLGPALIVGGVVRGVHGAKVDNEIQRLQTALPVQIEAAAEEALTLFFPLAPSPSRVMVTYADDEGDHELLLDTAGALHGLHLDE